MIVFLRPLGLRLRPGREHRRARGPGEPAGLLGGNALRLQELFVHGLPPDEWDTFAARTAALGPGALRAAKREWAVGREAIVVVGDEKRIGPQLRPLLPPTQSSWKTQ